MANLGQLTLDVVARIGSFTGPLDKAGRESKAFNDSVSQGFANMRTAVGVAASAVVASVTAMTVSTVQAAGEIQRGAFLAGTTNTEFQKYAAAAKVVGVESDKLSDILKDVNDKMGDFAVTGGGELKDFFEKIAPKVGITAAAFKNLSGPEALGLFVTSLEKAGANQQELTFFLESIANDATLLLPLLKNNAAGFKELGDAAAAAGGIMSDKTITAASQLKAVTWLLEQSSAGVSSQLVSGLIPSLVGVSAAMSGATARGEGLAKVGAVIGSVITGVAAVAISAATAVYNVGSSIGALYAAGSFALNGDLSKAAFVIKQMWNDNAAATASAKKAVSDLYSGTGKAAAQVKNIASFMDEAKRAAKGLGAQTAKTADATKKAGGAAKSTEDKIKKQTEAINEQIKALQLQAETVGWSDDNKKLYDLALKGANATQMEAAEAALKTVAAFEAEKKAQEDVIAASEEYSDLVNDLMTDDEKYTEQLKKRLAVMDAINIAPDSEMAKKIVGSGVTKAPTFGRDSGALSEFDTAAAELEAWYAKETERQELIQELSDKETEIFRAATDQKLKIYEEYTAKKDAIDRAREKAAQDLRLTSANSELALYESITGSMGEIAKNFAGESSMAYKAMFALQKIFAAAMIIVNTEIAASKAGAELGIFGLPMAAVIRATGYAQAGMVAGMALGGMAHDGINSVPEDGTWLLKKGERVTTADTSAKLDRTLESVSQQASNGGGAPIVNLYEDKSKAGQVESRQQDDRRVIDIWVADLLGDGKAQKAMSRKFGLQPVGA